MAACGRPAALVAPGHSRAHAGRAAAQQVAQRCSSTSTKSGGRRRPGLLRAAASGDGSSGAADDALFVAKLAATALVSGAAVKWGSLLTGVPFTPNSALAALLVATPPAAAAVYLLATARDEEGV